MESDVRPTGARLTRFVGSDFIDLHMFVLGDVEVGGAVRCKARTLLGKLKIFRCQVR